MNLRRTQRLSFIERGDSQLPLSVQAELLSLSRASVYYHPRGPSAQEVAVKHRIDEIYTDCPFYGSRRIAAQMRQEGLQVCRNTVANSPTRSGA